MGLFDRAQKIEERAQEIGATAVEAPSGILPPARSDFTATTDTALSIGAVYRCVQILANSASQLPLEVYRGADQVDNRLALQPDNRITAHQFWEQTVISLAMTGNAYWWRTNNSDGEVQNLTVLRTGQVNVRIQETRGWPVGKPVYSVGGKDVNSNQIVHLSIFNKPGDFMGQGPLQASAHDIETAYLVRKYGDSILSNGSVPTGVLSTDQFLNADQANAYRDAWNLAQSDRGLAVLGNGMNYQAVSLSPKDIQFLESQQFSIAQIARLFGIPAVWLNLGIDGSSLTYSNVEDLARHYLQTTLSPYLNTIEQNFSLLLPRKNEARFKLDALLRANLMARVDSYDKLIPLGVMSAEEARLSEGLPIPDGEVSPPPMMDGAVT